MHYSTAGSIHERHLNLTMCRQNMGQVFGLVQVDQPTESVKENFGTFGEVL